MGNSAIFLPQSPSRELDYSTLNYSPVHCRWPEAGGWWGLGTWEEPQVMTSGVVVYCPVQCLVVRKKHLAGSHLPPFRNPVCNHLCHRQRLLVLMLKERSDSGSHIWIGSSCGPPETGQRNSSVRVVSESTPILSAQPYLAPYQVRPGALVRVYVNGGQAMLHSQPL